MAWRGLEVGGSSVGAGLVGPVVCDDANPGELRAALGRVSGEWGPFGLAVCWVHSPHRGSVHQVIAEYTAEHSAVVDVLGSGAADWPVTRRASTRRSRSPRCVCPIDA